MSSANITNEKPIAAFVGIDWADQKHDIVLCAATSKAQFNHRSIGSDPDALAEWALEMQGRFGSQGRILICLEQSRGALIHFLMGYECFELYPINPKQLSSYRAAFRPSGAKDDPVDGKLLCQLIALHHQSLRPWRPDDEATRKLALLCEKRRKAIDTRTALSNQLKSELKLFFPLALSILDNDLTTALAADFLLAWPNFDSLKKASVNKVRKFFYAHQSRSEPKIQERLKCIEAARPLTRDSAIIETSSIAVRMLAQQLKNLVPFIALYDQLISELFDSHPESALFNNLPGAGKQLAPRLLTAFGSDRERFQCLLEALTFLGLAPVTEQSGNLNGSTSDGLVPNSCANPSMSSPPNRCAPALGQRASINTNVLAAKATTPRYAPWLINGPASYIVAGKHANLTTQSSTSQPCFNAVRLMPQL